MCFGHLPLAKSRLRVENQTLPEPDFPLPDLLRVA